MIFHFRAGGGTRRRKNNLSFPFERGKNMFNPGSPEVPSSKLEEHLSWARDIRQVRAGAQSGPQHSVSEGQCLRGLLPWCPIHCGCGAEKLLRDSGAHLFICRPDACRECSAPLCLRETEQQERYCGQVSTSSRKDQVEVSTEADSSGSYKWPMSV